MDQLQLFGVGHKHHVLFRMCLLAECNEQFLLSGPHVRTLAPLLSYTRIWPNGKADGHQPLTVPHPLPSAAVWHATGHPAQRGGRAADGVHPQAAPVT